MPADPRFYVDESLLPIGRALALVRRDVTYPGHRDARGLQLGVQDPEWLGVVGDAGWLVLTRDRRIRTKPLEIEALLAHGVRGVVLTGKRDQSSWQRLLLIVRVWAAMEELLDEPGPWLRALDTNGRLRPLALPMADRGRRQVAGRGQDTPVPPRPQ